MSNGKQPEPVFNTADGDLNEVERFKLESDGVRGILGPDFRNLEGPGDIEKASEQLAKSHGIYLEYNRAKTGREKDWMYMIRATIPGGGAFTADQWDVFDGLADKYCDNNPFGGSSLRLTTRQNVQYHWLHKDKVIDLVGEMASTGFYALNGCGDNVRNVMGCPLSKFSSIYDANKKAQEYGEYFRLPAAPHIQVFAIDPNFIRDPEKQYKYGEKLLNRKFKIAFSAVHRNLQTGEIEYDNCVEIRTNDLGVMPIVEGDKVAAYQLYIGGGQGEKNGKATFAAHGEPLGIVTEEQLMPALDGIVKVHDEWGDRKNRHWARLKYVVNAQGIPWYQDQLREKGIEIESPNSELEPGARMMHHGWQELETTGKLAFGAYIENGRLIDGENGKLKSMVRDTMQKFAGTELMITPNQDLLFTNIEPEAKDEFEAYLGEYGFGKRNGKAYSSLRVLSGACVGLPTCRLSYTESERFEPELIDTLDEMGYGDLKESIGITGCERQCFRPATKTIGWVGQGPNMYMLKLGGSEDGRYQGTALVEDEKLYFRQVPRDKVAVLSAKLFDLAKAHMTDEEIGDSGAVFRRLGSKFILDALRADEEIAPLMEKTAKAPFLPKGCAVDHYAAATMS
ncbi:Sulfite reductase [NADPH] hemoprotein beta-component [Poriferisphaera corsica]|uniref:Sulfite reductase [NADPH] hemoprotein beta-component n=1 Tax=Poriferisphaera corsica TaxID=2528020 RepID=A0A517YS92_9BACT|nr:nitrite/sulfite reductase [Poriferisphaera corsica]QDU33095.1 Sulfite reductase [NADPH] hemoprotein beta-component [Poriferisphaera corsica]